MKKWLAMSLMMLLFTIAVRGATITVTQPSGGEVTMTCPIQIAWTASGVTSNVKILLRKPDGAFVGTIDNNLPVSPGLYTWTVAAPAVADQSYKIHVRASDGSAEGESAVFTVVQEAEPVPGSISNVKLSGSSPYCLGTSYTVSWSISNVSQHLKLELIKGGAVTSVIAPDMLPGTSSKSWTAAGTAASDYKVRVSAIGAATKGESAFFELKTCGGTGGSASRRFPHGGESYSEEAVPGAGWSADPEDSRCRARRLPELFLPRYLSRDLHPGPHAGASTGMAAVGKCRLRHQRSRRSRGLLVSLRKHPGCGHPPLAHHFLFEWPCGAGALRSKPRN